MLLLTVCSREQANQLFRFLCEGKVRLLWLESLVNVILTDLPVLHWSRIALVNVVPAELY